MIFFFAFVFSFSYFGMEFAKATKDEHISDGLALMCFLFGGFSLGGLILFLFEAIK